jgi:hypothetical protein
VTTVSEYSVRYGTDVRRAVMNSLIIDDTRYYESSYIIHTYHTADTGNPRHQRRRQKGRIFLFEYEGRLPFNYLRGEFIVVDGCRSIQHGDIIIFVMAVAETSCSCTIQTIQGICCVGKEEIIRRRSLRWPLNSTEFEVRRWEMEVDDETNLKSEANFVLAKFLS